MIIFLMGISIVYCIIWFNLSLIICCQSLKQIFKSILWGLCSREAAIQKMFFSPWFLRPLFESGAFSRASVIGAGTVITTLKMVANFKSYDARRSKLCYWYKVTSNKSYLMTSIKGQPKKVAGKLTKTYWRSLVI